MHYGLCESSELVDTTQIGGKEDKNNNSLTIPLPIFTNNGHPSPRHFVRYPLTGYVN